MTDCSELNKRDRPSWDEYFLEITEVVAKRSTCLRRKVGCILVKDKRILTSGYNGAPTGMDHCHKTGCIREKLNVPSGERHELCRGLHAEQNAIIQGALHGINVKGANLYVTTQPCVQCAKIIANAKIKRVIFIGDYPDDLSSSILKEAGVLLEQHKK
ncbi:cytidine/deoxycytidylate deaminase family protein [Proteinivorax hydrogeniformans]|uniref:Cytidine/deoxycytidylate deaminase family protein n=1 Tax=Proteinivorax hydrogeniformans TaxID=1826727 RepID=A0AAU8HSQ6_9FIRM